MPGQGDFFFTPEEDENGNRVGDGYGGKYASDNYTFDGEPDTGFTVKDSGERQEFDSGMVRDTQKGKTNYTRVFEGVMLRRWAEHMTLAEAKYPDVAPGVANWTQAKTPEEVQRFRVSATRHFVAWLAGETDEDHAAGVFFNINGAETTRKKIQDKPLLPGGVEPPWFRSAWEDLSGAVEDELPEGDSEAEKDLQRIGKMSKVHSDDVACQACEDELHG